MIQRTVHFITVQLIFPVIRVFPSNYSMGKETGSVIAKGVDDEDVYIPLPIVDFHEADIASVSSTIVSTVIHTVSFGIQGCQSFNKVFVRTSPHRAVELSAHAHAFRAVVDAEVDDVGDGLDVHVSHSSLLSGF